MGSLIRGYGWGGSSDWGQENKTWKENTKGSGVGVPGSGCTTEGRALRGSRLQALEVPNAPGRGIGGRRMPLKTYRDLEVWQRAMDLVVDVYRLTRHLPSEEKFGLTSQAQRAAVSVPANIAEGYGRTHRGDYLRHLSVARGSLVELETLVTLTVRLEFVRREQAASVWETCQEVGRMLNKLIRSLGKTVPTDTPNPEP